MRKIEELTTKYNKSAYQCIKERFKLPWSPETLANFWAKLQRLQSMVDVAKVCKNCIFWGKVNMCREKGNFLDYRWCGHPKTGAFYNGGISDMEMTREDFGCILFEPKGAKHEQRSD